MIESYLITIKNVLMKDIMIRAASLPPWNLLMVELIMDIFIYGAEVLGAVACLINSINKAEKRWNILAFGR